MVGRGIVRIAKSQGITDIVEVTSKTCDLRNLQKTRELLLDTKPDVVIDAAAKVGGILTIEASIAISNVMIVDEDGKATRLGARKDENGKNVRISRRTGKDI